MFKLRKVGWSDKGRRGLGEGVGNCLKYLKMGRTEKSGGETKIFKRGGQTGSMGGCPKKRGAGTLLRTMTNDEHKSI